ncbi:MAG: hypothetical protein AB7O74_13930 [Candidatus Nanopelagicales bacterium]
MLVIRLAAGLVAAAALAACGGSGASSQPSGLSASDTTFIDCASDAVEYALQSFDIGISAGSDAYDASVKVRQKCGTPDDPELLKLRDDLGGTLKAIDDNTGTPDLVLAGWERVKDYAATLTKFKDLAREQRLAS